MTLPRKVYIVFTQPGLLPASVKSWHNARSTHDTAYGLTAVTRKQHAIFKVRWAIAWPACYTHTATLYILYLLNSQHRNNNGPHSAFINLPDHMGKQTDEHLRELSKTSPAAKPAQPMGHFFFSRNVYDFCVL